MWAFIKKYRLRLGATLILVGLILYTVYHVITASPGSLMTTPLRQITDLYVVPGTGYLFRDEEVITASGSGVVEQIPADGSKVGKNADVARFWTEYSAQRAASVQELLGRLDRMIAIMEKSVTGGSLADADGYRREADAIYSELMRAKNQGKWEAVASYGDSMLVLLNRYGHLTGSAAGLSDALSALQAERASLLRGTYQTVVNNRSSGSFYSRSRVDGLESVFTAQALEDLTPGSLASLAAQTPAYPEGETVIGKMVYGYTWYLAVDIAPGQTLPEAGDICTVRFPRLEGNTLDMTCQRVTAGEDGRAVAVLASSENPAWFDFGRVQTLELQTGSITGFYVPDAALVTLHGVEGVYILRDSTVRFRRVDVIRRGDGYCVVEKREDPGEEYLALYDILITSGNNLYEGKVY